MRQSERAFSAFLEGQLGGERHRVWTYRCADLGRDRHGRNVRRHKADYDVQQRRYRAVVRTTSDLSGLCFLNLAELLTVALIQFRVMPAARRFPPPWVIEENADPPGVLQGCPRQQL